MSQANNSTLTAKSSSKASASVKDQSAPPAAAAAAVSPVVSTPSVSTSELNVAQGLKQAHNDIMKWFFQSHGSVYDSNVVKLEASGVKRDHVVYGLVGFLVLYLLAGNYASFVSNLVVLVYPIMRTVQVFKTNNQSETSGLLSYWLLFAVFSVFDGLLNDFPAYFVARTAVLVFGFLPQTQGSCLIYSRAFKPLMQFVSSMLEKSKLI